MAQITQIIIGDELLSGKIQDLNLKWLATTLLPTKHKLVATRIIGDNEEQIKAVLTEASKESDAIIITGGLGPTKDDKTKKVLGDWIGGQMKENNQAMELAKTHYARWDREWTKELNSYHLIPEGITPLYNPIGFAPGLMLTKDNTYIFAAPGVPREFQGMLTDVILPIIDKEIGGEAEELELFNIRTYGIPEEVIFGKLCPTLWDDLEVFGSVSSLPGINGVDITIRLLKDNQVEEKKNKIKKIVYATDLAPNIWHIGLESLQEVVVMKAKEKGITFSFAESCTGGLVSSLITDISGSSTPFLGSIISYSNDVKIKQLGVKEETLKSFGAVSKETALEMAIGARERINSHIGISLTGIAGPLGGSKEKPVGTVAIGHSTSKESCSEVYNFHGDRIKLKERFAAKALSILLDQINKF
ncbi:CinA family nicotinamide mononucleotide deamidase-related protein [Bacteriovorax sp. Seq25_V]|uniref:CinA family nicotinamide mononucleotide deamidase-related protein n=1 Tax=Bacteriovorax sp. Seq25_V TaxID=1201288 RepID=UPI000389F984|nr:CinA family nicotinamide mononucleotide deamidase-related protein [Bacteriovorax sp. Seq25_V]EQC44887.1 competence/damage-inducible protein CinA [Bacteriovorax sp. Seq25_V]